MGDRLDQPCWSCKKCLKGCSWSRDFEPVKGWVATPEIIINGFKKTLSFKIVYCPEFDGEEPKPTNKICAKFLGVSERQFYRLRDKGKLPKNIYAKTMEFLKEITENDGLNNRTVEENDRQR